MKQILKQYRRDFLWTFIIVICCGVATIVLWYVQPNQGTINNAIQLTNKR